jgi:hypothetical protein
MQEVPLRRYHFAEFGSGFGCQVHRTGSKWGVPGLSLAPPVMIPLGLLLLAPPVMIPLVRPPLPLLDFRLDCRLHLREEVGGERDDLLEACLRNDE